jgi:hypothetical protein
MPAGIEEAPALICESRELTTPDGKAVTSRLALEGSVPDGRPTPGTEVVPALIWERSELTTPDGKAVMGRLTPDGRFEAAPDRPEAILSGIEVTPRLICDSNELTTFDGRAVIGTLTPEDRTLDGKMPPGTDVAPALI